MRIDTLSYNNEQTQGVQRRAWLRQYAPQHLEHCEALVTRALHLRPASAAQNVLVLGAGACTEVPLHMLCRSADEVVLADIDLAAMQRACEDLPSATLRKCVRLEQCDISDGVSKQLDMLLKRLPWNELIAEGAQALFDAIARCLKACPVPDPVVIPALADGEYGCVISSLVLSQLFSYPLLDVLDQVQRRATALSGEQERHRHYQEAAQNFRVRVINAHLHLLHRLLDSGASALLLSDVRGFAFNVYGTDHDAQHRRYLPLLPRVFPDLVRAQFRIMEEEQWEWISDLPEGDRPGRGYEVAGYILQ